jgi:hypothetical protein
MCRAHVAQPAEHFLGKEEATGSSPVVSLEAVVLESELPSSNGQDATLSRWRPGFDSPWERGRTKVRMQAMSRLKVLRA